jgi:hypothetical protein
MVSGQTALFSSLEIPLSVFSPISNMESVEVTFLSRKDALFWGYDRLLNERSKQVSVGS